MACELEADAHSNAKRCIERAPLEDVVAALAGKSDAVAEAVLSLRISDLSKEPAWAHSSYRWLRYVPEHLHVPALRACLRQSSHNIAAVCMHVDPEAHPGLHPELHNQACSTILQALPEYASCQKLAIQAFGCCGEMCWMAPNPRYSTRKCTDAGCCRIAKDAAVHLAAITQLTSLDTQLRLPAPCRADYPGRGPQCCATAAETAARQRRPERHERSCMRKQHCADVAPHKP